MNSIQGIMKMNQMGSAEKPFFFIIDAWAQNWIVETFETINTMGILWEIDSIGNAPVPVKSDHPIKLNPTLVTEEEYACAFRSIQAYQKNGESWLANLTFASKLDCSLTLEEIFARSQSACRLYIPDELTVFSPEKFISITTEGQISSFPMKGTIDATIPNAASLILADPKESAEHVTIVDLIRNDLGKVAKNICVPRYRFLTEIQTAQAKLLQVSSQITGNLESNWKCRIGEILAALLPAGSVTGAPKKRTIEIIRHVEKDERKWYTGIFGYFDGEKLDSAVSIRVIKQEKPRILFYHSGGGITIYSKLEQEYRELKDKIYVPFAGNNPL